MRMASSHPSRGMLVIVSVSPGPNFLVMGDMNPLSPPVTCGPAFTIPSRASASVMTEERGPCPIGLREMTSTPMARAASMTVKGRER